jgi:hypothetical protein
MISDDAREGIDAADDGGRTRADVESAAAQSHQADGRRRRRRDCVAVDVATNGPEYMSTAGRCIARSTSSGIVVGPGTARNSRPARTTMHMLLCVHLNEISHGAIESMQYRFSLGLHVPRQNHLSISPLRQVAKAAL